MALSLAGQIDESESVIVAAVLMTCGTRGGNFNESSIAHQR